MTKNETAKILTILQASYPNFKPQSMTNTLEAWSAMLSDYDFNEISIALKRYIVSDGSGFAPSIGQIIAEIPRPREVEPLEAWGMVRKALKNSIYGAEEEFSRLAPEIQQAIGSPENLREIAKMNTSEVETVEQSHFIRSYRTVCERKKHESMIPEELRIKNSETLRIGG